MTVITVDTGKMNYSPRTLECLRFGGRVGGEGIGTCAIDIFQGFVNDPDAEAEVQLREGDSLYDLPYSYGPTNKDVFLGYLRTGTHSTCPLPNHTFFASMSKYQAESFVGQKWLKLLKENGFEFVRAIDNSVYSGTDIYDTAGGPSIVYIFGLFRNIGEAQVPDPMKPPKGWDELPTVSQEQLEEDWGRIDDPSTLRPYVEPSPSPAVKVSPFTLPLLPK